MNKAVKTEISERGGAGVKLLAVVVVLVLLAHAGYQFIPVAYNCESLKQDMQTAVVQGLALPGRMTPVDSVKEKIRMSIKSNNIPADAVVDVKQAGNLIQARVVFTTVVPILPFGIYKYHYDFDHTATPTGFLTKQ